MKKLNPIYNSLAACVALLLIPGFIYSQSPVIYGHPTNINTTVTVTITKQKGNVTEKLDSSFYGICETDVTNFLKSQGINTAFKTRGNIPQPPPTLKSGNAGYTEKVICTNKVTAGKSITSFEEQTKAFYGDSYDNLDKTIVEIKQFQQNDKGGNEEVFRNKIITVNRTKSEPSSNKNIILEDSEERIAHLLAQGKGCYKIATLDSTYETDNGEEIRIKRVLIESKDQDKKISGKRDLQAAGNELKEVTIIPNPASDHINISFFAKNNLNAVIRVIDVTGKEIFNESIKNFSGQFNRSIDLSTYSKGTYFLSIVDQDQLLVEKKFILK